jgi:hypothetical protein
MSPAKTMAYRSYLDTPEAARVGVRALFRNSSVAGVAALPRDVCEMVARFVPEERWAVVWSPSKSEFHLVTAPIGEKSTHSSLATWDPWDMGHSLYMECHGLRRMRTESSGPKYLSSPSGEGVGVQAVSNRIVLEAATFAGRRFVQPTYSNFPPVR